MGGSSLKGNAAVAAAAAAFVCSLSTYRRKIQHPVDVVTFQLPEYEIICHKITVAVFSVKLFVVLARFCILKNVAQVLERISAQTG